MYGFTMDLKDLSKLLIDSRHELGKKSGIKKHNGDIKPIGQKEASEKIGCSYRKYAGVEGQEYNFSLKVHEVNALNFIKNALGWSTLSKLGVKSSQLEL